MKKIILLIFCITILACTGNNKSSDGVLGIMSSGSDAESAVIPQEADNIITPEETEPVVLQPDKIIKTADIGFEVADYGKSKRSIDSLVKVWGGYISDENEYSTGYQIINNIVIRVSNKNFENLLNAIGKTSARLDYKQIHSMDVTEEYVDIAARLKTKKEIKKRYQALLQKTIKIDDILKIENEIRVIQEEIEAKEGRLKYLDSRVAFSTINLKIHQVLEYKYKPRKEINFFTRSYKALYNGWKGLLSFLIGLMHIWPIILLVAGGLVLYFRTGKRKKNNL